jgi:2-polyprenyl-3-methyl-5-hydroxy-6-metoxy-1,4-benzoquinol methylase
LGGELRRQGLHLQEMTGMVMHPLTFAWSLNPKDVSVNYVMVAKK